MRILKQGGHGAESGCIFRCYGQALETYYGWDNINLNLTSTSDRSNARKGTSGPTKALAELEEHPHILNKFGEMHLLDRQLYEYANSLLDASLQAIGKF